MTPADLDALEQLAECEHHSVGAYSRYVDALIEAAPALIAAARERDEWKQVGNAWRSTAANISDNYVILKAAAAQLWDALAEKQEEYEYTVDRGVGHLMAFVKAKDETATLRTRVAELEARLEKVGKLHDQWWNHGDELDALYAERLSAALTPPEAAAGKEAGKEGK